MGCNTSTATVKPIETVRPVITSQSDEGNGDVHLMYSQLFNEFLSQMTENNRSKVISFCPDLYRKENASDLISSNPYLLKLTNNMRNKIQDENPFFSMGCLMLEMNSYDRAEYFYLKSLLEEENNWIRLIVVYNHLANVYYKQDKYDQALKYYHKSINIHQKYFPEDCSSLTIDYNNIGIIYQKQNHFHLALQFFQNALKLQMKTRKSDKEVIALLHKNIASIYNDQANFAPNLNYYQRDLQSNERFLSSLALSHHHLAISLFLLDRFDQALDHAKKANKIASQSLPDDHRQRTAHQDLLTVIQRRMQ